MSTKFGNATCPILRTIDEEWLLSGTTDLTDTTLVDIDLRSVTINWDRYTVDATTLFIGCTMDLEVEIGLRRRGANFLHAPGNLPYRPLRRNLYTYQELMEGYSKEEDNSKDLEIYNHFEHGKQCPSINEALWQRMHDFSVDEGLRRLLNFDANGLPKRKAVGFMGGHSTSRTSPDYKTCLITAKQTAEAGYFVVSGGGPGIMEAANLGAYLAGASAEDLAWVFETLATAPSFKDAGFQDAALAILERFPEGTESLAIPTWFYGHEPSNLFASYIAKYFSNSIREDTLLAIALYGIVYAPGSAGTTQEIFMDATQNHYVTFDFVSPMVFLGTKRYSVDTQLYPVLTQLAEGKAYADYLFLTDDPAEVVTFIDNHPPLSVNQ
jgi:predicted Rossmann-fold nucleotide-binding protein